jgi:hypothetical protein
MRRHSDRLDRSERGGEESDASLFQIVGVAAAAPTDQ